MAVVKEISVEYCRKVRFMDDAYKDLPEEEVKRREQYAREHASKILSEALIKKQLSERKESSA